MYKQYLPTYSHNFEKCAFFSKRESEHYIFHYFSNSEAEKDIDLIIKVQEKSFSRVLSFLTLPPPKKKIEYFFYPDSEIKQKLMGDDWFAQAIYDEFRVHVLYTIDIKPIGPHEDVHLLTLPLGLSIGFFQEGLAEYFTDYSWDGKKHAEHLIDGLNKKIYPPIKSFFRHEAWLETNDEQPLYFYALAKEFTAFLINKFGIKEYKKLYSELNRENTADINIGIFENNFEVEFDVIEKEFWSEIKNVSDTN